MSTLFRGRGSGFFRLQVITPGGWERCEEWEEWEFYDLLFFQRIFPIRIDFRFELPAADEFLEVADDGASGDAELTGKGGDIGAVFGLAEAFADSVLSAEAVGGAAEEFLGVDAMGAFEGFELSDGFGLPAFFEGDFDGFFQGVDVDGFGQAEVSASRALEGFHLLADFECAGDDDDGDEGEEFFEFGEEVEAEFAFGKDVIEDEEVEREAWDLVHGFAAIADADEMIGGKRLFVDFVLEVVVFDDEDGGIHRCCSVMG